MTSPAPESLQEKYAPKSVCFGCGPANDKGLRVRSVAHDDGTCTCDFRPEPHQLAFPGAVNGGICGTLLDCHSNWTAAYHLMKKNGLASVPCTVTAEFAVKLKRPTPIDQVLHLTARVVESGTDRATVEAEIIARGKDKDGAEKDVVTATCRGVFVAVKEGHPAFHRW